MRTCEICGGGSLQHIHRQEFLFPGEASPVHYDVVACRGCGFAFASEIPDQSALNRFYQGSEHHLHTDVPAGLARIHDDFFAFVRQHVELSAATRVLDIGSGMGHFLSRFKSVGLQALLGIEPSPLAARLGREYHDLEIRTETLDTYAPTRPFGLVSLCGVLEHIADLRSSVMRIGELIEEGGYLFIAVPDAESFGASPPAEAFLEFALEHINFFSATSLDNLLSLGGFEKVEAISQHNDFYDNNYLLAIYRKASGAAERFSVDGASADSLHRYIEQSRQTLRPIEAFAEQLELSGERVLIWGAGSLTSRLLCDTRLGRANICGIVDRNRNLQGRSLLGVTISAPESIMKHEGATIFIASTTYAVEIRDVLMNRYGWRGRVVSLVSGVLEN